MLSFKKLFYIFIVCWSSNLFALDIPSHPLTIEKISLSSSQLAPGSNAEVKIHVALLPNHHAYLEQFKLVSSPENALKLGKLNIEPIVIFYDKFSKKNKSGIENKAVIKTVFEVPENVILGEHQYSLKLIYQACTNTYCHLPKTADVLLKINIVSESQINELLQKKTIEDDSPDKDSHFAIAQKKGIFYLVLLVFLAGVLTSFTPCIFPMIPITLAVLSGHKKQLSHWQGFLRSSIYVFGIALAYVCLGLFAASTGSLFGSFLGSPIFATFLALLFLAMALSMFGLFELKAPHFIEKRLMKMKTEASLKGVFIAGLLAGAVASPCVGPVLIGILTFVAKSQDLFLGALLLFVFAFGFGLLFIVLGSFSHIVKKLPKAGHWMIEVRDLFGWVMLALAIYYIRPVLTENTWWLVVSVVLITTASTFGAFQTDDNSNKWTSCKKGWLLTAFILGVFLLIRSLFPGFTSSPLSQINKLESAISWQNYSQSTLNQAKMDKKGVIIDFWADWCAACKELEENTFPNQKVLALKDRFVWIKFDATQSTEEFVRLQKKYKILGLPHIAFYAPSGKLLLSKTLNGFEEPEEFASRMKEVLTAK
ncbi:MAG: protein-disulfide reductase DsbD [Bdellovibrionaceae bacterium]|nr:protein-disulfide reductase DsbD [Pseudobdellovibrionaceae bacterium]